MIWSINRIQGHQNINQQFLTTLTPVSAASQCQSGSVIRSNTTMMQLSIGLDKDSNNPISSGMYTLMASYPSGERKNLTLNINVSGKLHNINYAEVSICILFYYIRPFCDEWSVCKLCHQILGSNSSIVVTYLIKPKNYLHYEKWSCSNSSIGN